MKTLYQVLQVAPDASPDIIRMAHRVLAARFHPDNLQTGNSQAFREVNEAFEVLKNAGDRAHYDAEMTGFVPGTTSTAVPGSQSRHAAGRSPHRQDSGGLCCERRTRICQTHPGRRPHYRAAEA